MKKSFSQSVSEPEFLFSIYNISTDQSKDDSHLETAGDYVLNTLLVRAARGSSQIVSVGLDVCEDVWLSFTFLKKACTFVHETSHTAFLCLSPEAY